MNNTNTVLVTGAMGEMGHALINYLTNAGSCKIVALDLRAGVDSDQVRYISGSVADRNLVQDLANQYDFNKVFHLAAILSTGGEKNPELAHQVNVEGGLNILNLARTVGKRTGQSVKVMFPSTVAVYGISDLATKQMVGSLKEDQFLSPITMYGINKLYVERLGQYYDSYYRYLENPVAGQYVDFRAVRYPGILSAETVPTGGTSDYGPEMLHAAAQGLSYECFVNPESRIPFMVMPDAVKALIQISSVAREKLKQRVYNVTSFAPSAKEIETEIKKYFPSFQVSYKAHLQRLNIVESWPQNMDDAPARQDWNWQADFNFVEAFKTYLVPAVRKRYENTNSLVSCANH